MLNKHHSKIDQVTLIPSTDGVHEVTYGDTVLHSKRETGKHPDPEEVLDKLADS